MNKKILSSLLIIGVVGAVAGGSTLALFNDTETSDTNTFEAGALDLQVDWVEYYNGQFVEERELDDLENEESIFDLRDVKPGDEGETQVSLHVFDNPAHVWMNATQTGNRENGCTNPESEVDDTCEDPGEGDGELGEHLNFLIYQDDDGDRERDAGEEVIFNGTAEELNAEGEHYLGEFENSTTEYVMVEWNVPRETGNIIQTDSKHFRFDFRAEQSRHNPVNGDNGAGEEEPTYTAVNWQVDLAKGNVIENFTEEGPYGDRLQRYAHGHTNESGPAVIGDTGSGNVNCIESSTEYNVSGNATHAEAETTVEIEDENNCEDKNVTISSYENTGDLGWSGGQNQVLHDYSTITIGEEVEVGEEIDMEVELPPAEVEE